MKSGLANGLRGIVALALLTGAVATRAQTPQDSSVAGVEPEEPKIVANRHDLWFFRLNTCHGAVLPRLRARRHGSRQERERDNASQPIGQARFHVSLRSDEA